MGKVWLIGGTQESVELARAIAQAHVPCIVTVTTEPARVLYPNLPGLTIWVGHLHRDTIETFLQTQAIQTILDASHPFAVEISRLAIAIAEQYQIPYLRYERPELEFGQQEQPTPSTPPIRNTLPSPLLLHLDSFATLLAGEYLTEQRVLLTIGYRPLPLFQPWHDRTMLFARILPSLTALESALNAGFTSDRLIALRPPVSAAVERALWQQWDISLVVTKASGVAGGEDVKQQVAAELGVSLIVIDRPAISYPQQTSNFSNALEFISSCTISVLPSELVVCQDFFVN
jgi:precorrin-6A/cobalt-precorrin-6A reductase